MRYLVRNFNERERESRIDVVRHYYSTCSCLSGSVMYAVYTWESNQGITMLAEEDSTLWYLSTTRTSLNDFVYCYETKSEGEDVALSTISRERVEVIKVRLTGFTQ